MWAPLNISMYTWGLTPTANTYPNASRMLKHFLDNTETAYTLPGDFNSSTTELADKRLVMSNDAVHALPFFSTGDFMVKFGQKSVDTLGETAGITDWKLAVNRCELWTKVYCYSKTSSAVYLHVRDFYDWTGGNTYGGLNVAASSLERLHRAGWAREYPVYGYGLIK